MKLIKRLTPKSIERQDVPHIEVFPDRELTAEQQKEVMRAKQWWQLQLKKTYKKLNA